MAKATIIFAVIVLAFVYVDADRPKCPSICHEDAHSPVRCVRVSASSCRKMRQCSIDEENCRRRLLKQRHLTLTGLSHCRNIETHIGSGVCAGRRPIRKLTSACKRLIRVCDDGSKVRNCYRSKINNCRLLTVCEAKRLNCRRGWSNAIRLVRSQHCVGISIGKTQRCRAMPKGD